jgi:hypothetical protein
VWDVGVEKSVNIPVYEVVSDGIQFSRHFGYCYERVRRERLRFCA